MTVEISDSVRFLVACGACERQFDATSLAAGSLFHCPCGERVEVPRRGLHDAAVVRCSSCSAPRRKGAESCEHCGADFTLHERDLHTICPACMSRISDGARFCHSCGTGIVAQSDAGRPTETACPACGQEAKLNGRRLGDESLSVLECPRCVGLWVERKSFELLADEARKSSAGADSFVRGIRVDGDSRRGVRGVQSGPMYRRCPECDAMMNRQNFGKRSGVIIDICSSHGFWFDPDELEGILDWIKSGGERASHKREDEERSAKKSGASEFMSEQLNRMANQGGSFAAGSHTGSGESGSGLVFGLIRTLLDI